MSGHGGFTAAERRLVTFSTLAATMMQALDTTIANVALPHMRGGLSASQEQIGWVLTSYIVAAAIATAPTGYLANRFGVKRVFLVAVTGFTVASMLCGIATGLAEMVVFRCLQGLFGAALVPLSQTALLDAYPPARQGSAMAMWGMGVMVGPVLGPLLGGWLTENYSWHWVFFINLPIGIAAFMGLSAGLREDGPRRAQRFDFTGFAFLSIAIGALQLMLDRGQTKGWFDATEVVVECVVAVAALYLFLVHTFTSSKPFIPPSLFRDRNLCGALVIVTMLGVVVFSTFAILPPFLQSVQNYPVITAGAVMAPRGLGTMLAMLVVGRALSYMDARLPLGLGLLFMAASLFWMSRFPVDVPMRDIVASGFVQGVGMGLIFVPLSTLAFATLTHEYRSDGTALYNLMRNIGSSVGIAAAFAYQDYGTKVARSALVENIHYANPSLAEFFSGNLSLLNASGLAYLDGELERQAATIGMLGDFHYMSLGILLALPLLLLLRPVRHMRGAEAGPGNPV